MRSMALRLIAIVMVLLLAAPAVAEDIGLRRYEIDGAPETASREARIEFTTDAELEAALLAAVRSGENELYVYDRTQNEFNAQALALKISDMITGFAVEYGCSVSGYGSNAASRMVAIWVDYVSAGSLPEPFATTDTGTHVAFSFPAAGGGRVTDADCAGRRTLLIFGRTNCYNTLALLRNLSGAASILRDADVQVIVGLLDYGEAEDLAGFVDTYSHFTCVNADANRPAVFYMMAAFGFGGGEFTLPSVILQDSDGELIYHSTGYVQEPLRLVATAVQGQLPVVTLPASATEVADGAFEGDTSIREVHIGGNVMRIGANAFRGCSALEKIIIPGNVSFIGEGAFDGCEDLTIHCPEGSAAQQYAQANGIDWVSID